MLRWYIFLLCLLCRWNVPLCIFSFSLSWLQSNKMHFLVRTKLDPPYLPPAFPASHFHLLVYQCLSKTQLDVLVPSSSFPTDKYFQKLQHLIFCPEQLSLLEIQNVSLEMHICKWDKSFHVHRNSKFDVSSSTLFCKKPCRWKILEC